MDIDRYKDFAERYDWMKDNNSDRDNFFKVLFSKHNSRSILDCACGTGSDLIYFKSLGLDAYGSDLSDAMLVQSKRKVDHQKVQIPIIKADFCNLNDYYDSKFDVVVCLSNAINEIHDEAAVIQALTSMKSVLKAGGLVVLDQGQTDASMKNPPKYAPVANKRDFSRLFVLDYPDNFMDVQVFDFIHTDKELDFKQSFFRISIRLKDDWVRLLSKAGFSKVDYYGDWQFTPYDKLSSQRLILVAHN